MKRHEAIVKAKKLKALADRGVGGERVNAKAQLDKIIRKYSLTEFDVIETLETHYAGHGMYIHVEPRKCNVGDIVLAGYTQDKMIVVDVVLCMGGWKYTVRYLKKDGKVDKRQSARCYFSKDIIRCQQKMLPPHTHYQR